MMKCEDVKDLLSAYLDRELPEADRLEVSAHVDACARCTAEKQSLLSLKETLRAEPMPRLPAEVIARIEAETLWKPRWWQRAEFRRRALPAFVGLAAAAAAFSFWKTHQTPVQSPPLQIVQPVVPQERIALHRRDGNTSNQDLQ